MIAVCECPCDTLIVRLQNTHMCLMVANKLAEVMVATINDVNARKET